MECRHGHINDEVGAWLSLTEPQDSRVWRKTGGYLNRTPRIMKGLTLLGLAVPSAIALNIPSQQVLFSGKGVFHNDAVEPAGRETCPQASKVPSPNDGLHSSLIFLEDEAFRARQAKRLSRAVQIPTTVGDYATDPYDEAFEPVVRFQELLEQMFPLV